MFMVKKFIIYSQFFKAKKVMQEFSICVDMSFVNSFYSKDYSCPIREIKLFDNSINFSSHFPFFCLFRYVRFCQVISVHWALFCFTMGRLSAWSINALLSLGLVPAAIMIPASKLINPRTPLDRNPSFLNIITLNCTQYFCASFTVSVVWGVHSLLLSMPGN